MSFWHDVTFFGVAQGSGFTVQKLKEKLIKVEKVQRFKVKNRIIPATRNREPRTWNLKPGTLNREPKTLIRYVVYDFTSIMNPAKLLPDN